MHSPAAGLRVIIDDGDDEVAEAKKREKALVEHVAAILKPPS